MEDTELQERLQVLEWLSGQGWVQLAEGAPQLAGALSRLRKMPDGTFDVSSVEPPVKALCNMLDAIVESLPKELWEGTSMELPELDLPPLEKARESSNDFMRDAVQAANIVIRYLWIAAHAIPLRPLGQIQRAILVGHMVRLAKLYDSTIRLVVEQRLEIVSLLLRPLAETAINLLYFVERGNDTLYAKYVKAALAYDKRLWQEIERRKQTPPLPIEERIQKSVERLFRDSGFKLEEVSWEDREWGSAFDRAAAIKRVNALDLYEFVFRMSSHAIHGSWTDLKTYHLEPGVEPAVPEADFHEPRIEAVAMPSTVSLSAGAAFLTLAVGKPAEFVIERLEAMGKWHSDLTRTYEAWYVKKQREARDKPAGESGTGGDR